MRTLFLSTVRRLLFLAVLACVQNASAQNLTGVITDEAHKPLPYVTVSLPALHRGVLADEQGKFTIKNLPPGVYTVEFIRIGYKNETHSITMASHDVTVELALHQSALQLPGVVVTGKPQPTDILSSSQSVTAV